MRIICCRFGDKFTQWHVDNLKHMIDTYSGIKYDKFEVIEKDFYGNKNENRNSMTTDGSARIFESLMTLKMLPKLASEHLIKVFLGHILW